MKKYTTVEKQTGETPLRALERYRKKQNIPADIPMAYAGRLDPMASGKLLILIGDECKKQERYNQLDKEYAFSALFGIKTDTGDVLGLAQEEGAPKVTKEKCIKVAKDTVGVHTFSYPVYSSKSVEGKPLFKHAHEGTLGEITIPTKKVRIYNLRCNGIRAIAREKLIDDIIKKIKTLRINPKSPYPDADFRREEIIQRWQKLKKKNNPAEYHIADFTAIVSTGTYIRTLAPYIAEKLGTRGLAWHIHRTKIGKYFSFGTLFGFWARTY